MDAQHLDAKLEAVEARTDTKFAELIGEMRLISSNLMHLSIEVGEVKAATASIKANILTATLTICGLYRRTCCSWFFKSSPPPKLYSPPVSVRINFTAR